MLCRNYNSIVAFDSRGGKTGEGAEEGEMGTVSGDDCGRVNSGVALTRAAG